VCSRGGFPRWVPVLIRNVSLVEEVVISLQGRSIMGEELSHIVCMNQGRKGK
jgi:hypothetical protein